MTPLGWLQIALFAALVMAVIKPLGGWIARIVEGKVSIPRPLATLESGLYRLAGVDPAQEQTWAGYAFALMAFNFAGILALYGLQRFQNVLPFNPEGLDAVPPDLALNTAASFATNTSWQSYGGETTLSYLTQMAESRSNHSSPAPPVSPSPLHSCEVSPAVLRLRSEISGST